MFSTALNRLLVVMLLTGATGSPGDTGGSGRAGPAGSRGSPGTRGLVGAQGVPGAQGRVGPRGAPGPTGFGGRGETGATGFTGATGQPGMAGDTGLAGEGGAIGFTGDTGDRGAAGPAGRTGEPGQRGRDGKISQELFTIARGPRHEGPTTRPNVESGGRVLVGFWGGSIEPLLCQPGGLTGAVPVHRPPTHVGHRRAQKTASDRGKFRLVSLHKYSFRTA